MKAIDLYKFVHENKCEWNDCRNNNEPEVILFVDFYLLKDFAKLLGNNFLDEGGQDCAMKQYCLCFEMDYICEYFGIELEEIFSTKE